MTRSLLLAWIELLGPAVMRASAADLPALPLEEKDAVVQSADIAWMLTASALVLLMTPGLALF